MTVSHFLRLCCSALFLALFAACSGSSGDDAATSDAPPSAPPGSGATHTVGGMVTGLTSDALSLQLTYHDAQGLLRPETLKITADGPFMFATALPEGASYGIAASLTDDLQQRCSSDRDGGTIATADVTDVVVSCVDAHTISGTAKGLEGSGLRLAAARNASATQIAEPDATGAFTFYGFVAGDSYQISVDLEPTAPPQHCRITHGDSGTMPDADVDGVQVSCGDATVSFTVSGLLGSGFAVALKREVEVGGNVEMLVAEHDDVAANGEYTFDTILDLGEPYEVEVWQQPADPDQLCWVEHAAGTITGDVTDVAVKCPELYRYFRFDDSYTVTRAVPLYGRDPNEPNPPLTPLKEGETHSGGVLDDGYLFDIGPAVPLGFVSGLDTTELFELYLDRPGAQGVLHSNATGKTYWLATESPPGPPKLSPDKGLLSSHHVTLDTEWAFKKVGSQATFTLHLTRIHLLALDNRDAFKPVCGSLRAGADLRIRAFDVNGSGGTPQTFFDTHGKVELIGAIDGPCNGPVEWQIVPEVRGDALSSLWATDSDGEPQATDFILDAAAGVNVPHPEQVAFARLAQPITVSIDLSAMPAGAEIVVVSEAQVLARNSLSNEGGAAAFLRDPAAFDPGQPDGGMTVETTGLALIDPADMPPFATLVAATPPAPLCDSPTAQRSVLAFEADSYAASESGDPSPRIRITRSGSLAGSVAAHVRLTGGSAVADEDFIAGDLIVRFGDGSNTPRTIDLPIIDDGTLEADETLTLQLTEPEGCAEIGAPATAEVTLVDDDNTPGAIAFGSADFQVDENAGAATLSLVRTGGTLGTFDVTVATADGSASAGDYTPVLTTVTFADGDAGPHEIVVPILDDFVAEVDETVMVTVSSPSGGVGSPASAVLTIRDDDQNRAQTVQFAAAQFIAVAAAGTTDVSVTRYGDVSAAASVTLATSDGTAIAGEDYESVNTVVAFGAGESQRDVPIVILGSAAPEPDQTLTLQLSAPSAVALGTPATAELVITADDVAGWGAWQADVEIDAAGGAAGGARIAFDGSGNALAIWQQETGGHGDVWSNYYESGVGWSGAVLVEGNDADPFAGNASVGFDGSGNALAVWTQTDAITGNASAWANRFAPGTGWSTPERLETDSNPVTGTVELAMRAAGDAVAVWAQFDGAHMNVYANRYAAGSGWGGAELVDELDQIVDKPQVAIDADGDIWVVWQQSPTGVVRDIWARHHTAASGWEPSLLLSTTNAAGAATNPKVAFDASGNAMAIWQQNPGFDRALHASRYTDADGWDRPQIIGAGDGVEQHQLAIAPDGNAFAIWRRAETINGAVVLTAFTNRYAPGAGWQGAEAISAADVFYPKLAFRPDGHALAVWAELDATQPPGSASSVWSNRYTSGIGWRLPEQIGSSGSLIGTDTPNLAIGPDGAAFAIWTRGGEVRVSRFE